MRSNIYILIPGLTSVILLTAGQKTSRERTNLSTDLGISSQHDD